MYTSAEQSIQTSRLYDFQTTFTFEKIVDMAYARIGKNPSTLTDDDVEFARYAANLEIREWEARQTTLCLIQREYIEFVTGQPFYKVPDYVYRPLTWVRSNITRLLGGTAMASEGNASPCFDPNSTAGLTQTTADGYISYNFPGVLGKVVWYVGILTLEPDAQIYTINIEYSMDNVNWIVQKSCPQEAYYPRVTKWWVCEWPPSAPYWRIRETRGAKLKIQQVYFSEDTLDIAMGKIRRDDYMNFPNKLLTDSAPTTVYYNEKIARSIYVYGNSYTGLSGLTYTAKVFCQDIDQLFQSVSMDAKWYKPLVAGMSYQLGIIHNSPNIQLLKMDYDESYANIAKDDGEDGPAHISIDLSTSWANV